MTQGAKLRFDPLLRLQRPSPVVALSGGGACAVLESGELKCWGRDP
jgi:hypothetical protein